MEEQIRKELISLVPKIAKETQPIFEKNNWVYGTIWGSAGEYIPTEGKLRECLSELIDSFQGEDFPEAISWCSGRLEVYRDGRIVLRGTEMEWRAKSRGNYMHWEYGWLL